MVRAIPAEWWEPTAQRVDQFRQQGLVDPTGLIIERIVPGKKKAFSSQYKDPVRDGLLLLTSEIIRGKVQATHLDDKARLASNPAEQWDLISTRELSVVGYSAQGLGALNASIFKRGRTGVHYGSFAAWREQTLEAQRLETERLNAEFNALLSRLNVAHGRGGKRVILSPPATDNRGRTQFALVGAADLVPGNLIRLHDGDFAVVDSNVTGDRTFKRDAFVLKLAQDRGEMLPARYVDYVRTLKVKKIYNIDTLKLSGSTEINPEASYERWGWLETN
jgi:hypothetical protein